MAKRSLSSVDTAWLRMEHPTNLMMITGVMIFRTPIPFERLKATLEQRLLRFERFRQRVSPPRLPWGEWTWQEDAEFDLNRHLQRLILPAPGDKAALQDVVSELMSTPLDFSRPLWELHLVEAYGDGCALIARLHHCIGDGIALVRVLLSLTDPEAGAPWPSSWELGESRDMDLFERFARPTQVAVKSTTKLTKRLLRETRAAMDDPSHALEVAKIGPSAARALARLALLWPDPKTLYKGELGVPKRAAWSAPIPLADVKAAGSAVGGTVNDVLLTAVTGALRRYMERQGDPVDNVNFRAVVPVNLRPLEEELTLGNRFGLVFLSLPVGIEDPIERLRELKRRMDRIKDTPEAVVAFGILNAIGMAPAAIQDLVVNVFGSKGTGVMTNVPGPRQTIYLAGAALDTIMFWVPQSGRLGLGVSILSYAGQVWLGVATDEGLVPDPEQIIAAFRAEFEALQALTEQRAATPTSESIDEMIARLDHAIATLTALQEKRTAIGTSSREPETNRCRALTKTGKRCKNRPRPSSEYCHVHQRQRTPANA